MGVFGVQQSAPNRVFSIIFAYSVVFQSVSVFLDGFARKSDIWFVRGL